MTEPVKLASIGLGQIARFAQLPAHKALANLVHTVGVFDDDVDVTRNVAHQYGTRCYSSLDQLLADPDVTAVEIAVPPVAQAPVIARALDAGKHVFAQKPLATTAETARQLVERAETAGLLLGVNQQLRYTGLIQRVRCHPVESVTEFSVFTHLPVGGVAPPMWFAESPRQTILFNSLHFIDAALFVMGRPVEVAASVERGSSGAAGERSVDVRIEFDGGRFARISEMRGEGGSPACLIRVDFPPRSALARMGIWDAYPQPSPDARWMGEAGVLALEEGGDWMVDAFRESLRDFAVGVSTGAPLPHSGRSHLASLEAVEAAYASALDGGASVAVA